MQKWLLACVIGLLTMAWPGTQRAHAQVSRRLFLEPGVILETGGRLGACDALVFTPDGRHLLTTGDDKVVRVWQVDDKGVQLDSLKNLRWSIFREQRGSIYALSLSPDKESRFVAVGGLGVYNGAVAVLDRLSGEVKHGLSREEARDGKSVWSIAFAPSGNQVAYGTEDGSVWLWDLRERENNPRRLGKHTGKEDFNYVRLVRFLSENEILSVAQNGQVARWNSVRPSAGPDEVFRFEGKKLFRATLSPDGKWLAVANQDRKLRLEVAAVDGRSKRTLPLDGDGMPQSLAFDARSERLAVGLREVPPEAEFFKILPSGVVLYDLREKSPTPQPGPRTSYYAEAVAFHPDGRRLAIAGGDNYDITLWNLSQANAPQSHIRGTGNSLWSVGLSKAGDRLGFRDHRLAAPPHPNQRGDGPWRVFDLPARRWSPASAEFQPVLPLKSAAGWTVVPSRKDAYVWNVVASDGQSFPLPLDPDRDGMPQCYTFLAAANGKAPRLAVGHYWGVSVFQLGESGPRRVRLFTGHQAEVMAVAPSADGRLLVTASRDQTIAAWSLSDWPSQAELGASFSLKNDKLTVSAVDPGSPGWEAGLTPGDEIALLYFAGKKVDGGPRAWLERLEKPIPGKELFLHVKHADQVQVQHQLTTVRQRPLWRFFPTRDGEWILWRWRDYYYDCSTQGDFQVGWQVSGEVDQTPAFYPAERFRQRFHRPDKVVEGLTRMNVEPGWVPIPQITPPEVRLALLSRTDDKVQLKVTVAAAGDTFVEQPQEVSLWINDYRLQRWRSVSAPFEKTIEVPTAALRHGANRIIAQAYNQGGARGDSRSVDVVQDGPTPRPRLMGLAVGISDYSKSRAGKLPNLLFPREDATLMRDTWLKQKENGLYDDAKFSLLLDGEATNSAILSELQRLGRDARPDDRFVLFLAGHGYSRPVGKTAVEPGTWTFVIPSTFDINRPRETGLTSRALFDALAALPCHKLVLLDACHAEGSSDLVRELTPDGVGPIIMSACDSREVASEVPGYGHGVFTQGIIEAFGDKFQEADRDRNDRLDADELFAYLSVRIPIIIEKNKNILGPDAVQTPRRYMGKKEEGTLPLIRRP